MQTVHLMQNARAAIRSGNYGEARKAMRQAIRENPENYHAWLLLARATPSTQAAMEYVNRAAALQPDSPLVIQAQTSLEKKARKESGKKKGSSRKKIAVFAGSAFLLLFILGLWFGLSAGQNVANAEDEMVFLAGIIPTLPSSNPEPTTVSAAFHKPVAPVNVSDEQTSGESDQAAETAGSSSANQQEEPPESLVDDENPLAEAEDTTVEETIQEEAGSSPEAADPPGELTESITATDEENIPLEETTTEEIVEIQSFPTPESQGIRPYGVGPYDRWIDVNLTTQTLAAYEGDVQVFNTFISSGLPDTPTVTGQFRTYMKYETQDMNGYLLGYDYYLQGVPYVMYFYNNFAIHGTYWHNSFGTPMSHGCVNMSPYDAGWLFEWAPTGTTVNIHN